MAVKVIDKDLGMKTIVTNMKRLDGAAVAIGFQGSEGAAVVHDGSDLSNVELAALMEFGAPGAGIPARSMIRAAFDEKIREWTAIMAKLAERIYEDTPASARRVLGIAGEKARADIINRINKGIPPPNQPQTIARKGSSKPLIDTKQMANSITYEVRGT